MSKAIHLRSWPFNSPLRALIEPGLIKFDVVDTIEKMSTRSTPEKMMEKMLLMGSDKLGMEFGCDGEKLYEAMRKLPRLDVKVETNDLFVLLESCYFDSSIVSIAFSVAMACGKWM